MQRAEIGGGQSTGGLLPKGGEIAPSRACDAPIQKCYAKRRRSKLLQTLITASTTLLSPQAPGAYFLEGKAAVMSGEQPAREPGPRGGKTAHSACWVPSFRAWVWLLLWAMLMCGVEPSQRTARVGSPSCDLDLQVCVCMPSVVLSVRWLFLRIIEPMPETSLPGIIVYKAQVHGGTPGTHDSSAWSTFSHSACRSSYDGNPRANTGMHHDIMSIPTLF